ncbi:4134_t:CDS:2, partial [Funneliformis geosporum]
HPRRIDNLASDECLVKKESTGRVDYAIKKKLDDLLEEIICITEGKQNQPPFDYQNILTNRHLTEAIYCTSKSEYRISLTEDALDDDTDLRKNVKRILEVIVGLLKDRVSVSDEPSPKRRRVQEKIKKK